MITQTRLATLTAPRPVATSAPTIATPVCRPDVRSTRTRTRTRTRARRIRPLRCTRK